MIFPASVPGIQANPEKSSSGHLNLACIGDQSFISTGPALLAGSYEFFCTDGRLGTNAGYLSLLAVAYYNHIIQAPLTGHAIYG